MNLVQPRRMILVLEEGAIVLAFLVAKAVVDEWELENVAVAIDHRRRGLGTRMVSEFLRQARHEKARAIFLEVRESNLAACAFYERRGFEMTGRRQNYYACPAEDALVYRLNLL